MGFGYYREVSILSWAYMRLSCLMSCKFNYFQQKNDVLPPQEKKLISKGINLPKKSENQHDNRYKDDHRFFFGNSIYLYMFFLQGDKNWRMKSNTQQWYSWTKTKNEHSGTLNTYFLGCLRTSLEKELEFLKFVVKFTLVWIFIIVWHDLTKNAICKLKILLIIIM